MGSRSLVLQSPSHATEWRRVRALPGVEWMRSRAAGGVVSVTHVPTEFGFGIVDSGVSDVMTRGRLQRLGPGLFCAQPGEAVTIERRYGPITHVRAITIDHATIAAAAGELGIDHRRLEIDHYAGHEPRLRGALERLWRVATTHRQTLELQATFARFLEVVFEVACDEKVRYSNLPQNTPGLRRARARILESCDTEITLDDLASDAGTTKAHFVRAFHRSFGVPPFAYLMHVRVEHARRMLGRGARPVDVAAKLFFTDQSHLCRWFVKSMGASPSGYQKENVPAHHLPEDWRTLDQPQQMSL